MAGPLRRPVISLSWLLSSLDESSFWLLDHSLFKNRLAGLPGKLGFRGLFVLIAAAFRALLTAVAVPCLLDRWPATRVAMPEENACRKRVPYLSYFGQGIERAGRLGSGMTIGKFRMNAGGIAVDRRNQSVLKPGFADCCHRIATFAS